jgi:hypothetical protein
VFDLLSGVDGAQYIPEALSLAGMLARLVQKREKDDQICSVIYQSVYKTAYRVLNSAGLLSESPCMNKCYGVCHTINEKSNAALEQASTECYYTHSL